MRTRALLLVCLLLFVEVVATAQRGIGGQIFLPNGAPLQRRTRFTLTTENGMRVEYYYTDSNGRISIPQFNSRFTITVESDGETYDTTSVSFDAISAGRYLIVSLRPLASASSNAPGTIDVGEVDRNVSGKAREAYESAAKLINAGQLDQAVEPLKRAISLQPNYFRAYNDLGVIYMKSNQLDLAEDALRQAIKINNRIYLPQLNLGIVLNRQGKYKEAVEVLSKLRHNRPELTAVHAPLIEALIEAKYWSEAEQELKQALTLKDVDTVDLKTKLGVVMIRQNKFAAAAATLREAIGAEPDNALAHFHLGAALLQTGSLDEAEKALRRSYEIKGASMAGAQLLLGQLYFQKKDYQKAIEAFNAYLRDFPDAPNAAQVKESIQMLNQALKNK